MIKWAGERKSLQIEVEMERNADGLSELLMKDLTCVNVWRSRYGPD